MWRDLAPILSYQNDLAQLPRDTVILAQDFLTHLRPRPDEQSAWAATYRELRARYAEGSI